MMRSGMEKPERKQPNKTPNMKVIGSCKSTYQIKDGCWVKKAPNTDAQQDSALALFKNLAQQADLPSLPSLPSLKPDIPSTSTKPDEGEEVPAPATVTVSSITTTSESEEQAPAPQEEEYIPVEATVLPPAAPTSTKPAAVYAPSNTSSAADIEANIGRRPYWMQHCQQIRSPLLRLHQGGCKVTGVEGTKVGARSEGADSKGLQSKQTLLVLAR
eukprot:scaffold13767_cov17-Tisochrysis_lutea.AAC.1